MDSPSVAVVSAAPTVMPRPLVSGCTTIGLLVLALSCVRSMRSPLSVIVPDVPGPPSDTAAPVLKSAATSVLPAAPLSVMPPLVDAIVTALLLNAMP